MYLFYTFYYKESGGWVQKYVGLWTGRSGRVVDGPLIVVASRVGDNPMSLTRAESRRQSVCKIDYSERTMPRRDVAEGSGGLGGPAC